MGPKAHGALLEMRKDMEKAKIIEVAADGTGDFAGIQEALDALARIAPDDEVPCVLHIAPGTYEERVEIRRPNVTLLGECADQVRIVGRHGAFEEMPDGTKRGTFRTYAVFVDASDCRLANLTIENAAGDGRKVGQALALYADGDRLVVDSCRLLGHQDTAFLGPLPPTEVKPGGFIGPKEHAPRQPTRQYWKRTYIEGDVDFIFGGATAYFESCELHSLDRGMDVNGYVTAASTPEEVPYGFVFHGCSFTGECKDHTVYLGRPWRAWAKTVLIDCWLGSHIRQDGWWDWNKEKARACAEYRGARLSGPGATADKWVSFASTVPEEELCRYSREKVLAGTDGWDPEGGGVADTETAHLSGNGRTLHTETYLSDDGAFERLFDQMARKCCFTGTTAEEFLSWQKTAREKLAETLRIGAADEAAPSFRLVSCAQVPGQIERRKYLVEVAPDVWMPVYMLVPADALTDEDGRMLSAICPHGHQGAGAASVAGIMGVPAVDEAIRRFNYDYGLRLAKLGYVAICPEARGWGERRSWKGQGDTETAYVRGTCMNEARMAEPLGFTLLGLLVSDLMRLIDWIETLPDLSLKHLGCVGFSGGGMQTLYLSALDERVKWAFISGYLYGVKDSLLHLNGNCSCNYVPGLWKLFDMGDIASLIAPRPLLVQSADHDHLMGPRGLANVFEQTDIVWSAYELLGAKDCFRHEVIAGEHHLGVLHFADDIAWLQHASMERNED